MALGLALSGGGIRGASHIGAIRALEEAGLKPDMIAGSSVGSIVASLYATGLSVDRIEEIFIENAPFILDIDFIGALGALFRLCALFKGKPAFNGFVKGNRIEAIIDEFTAGKGMSQTDIPLAITATDINDGASIVFAPKGLRIGNVGNVVCCSDNLISEAVRASIAVPIAFKPKTVEIRGIKRNLVDGGVANNLPADVLEDMGAKKIIGINLGYSGQRQERVCNIVEIGSQTVDIMMYHITKLRNKGDNVVELKYGSRTVVYPLNINRKTVVVNPQIYDVSSFDIKKMPQCIERGYEAVRTRLPEIKRILNLL